MSLLALRKERKRHKPIFVVKEAHHGGRVKWRWRAARGIHSTVRQVHHGKPAMPTPGYGSPKAVYGLHPSGMESVLVHNAAELLRLDTARQGVLLSSTLGLKKRLELLRLAVENKVRLLNGRDPQQELDRLTASFTVRKKAKQERQTDQQKKQAEKEKKAQEKKKKAGEKKVKGPGPEEKIEEVNQEALQLEEAQREEKELAEKVLIKPQ